MKAVWKYEIHIGGNTFRDMPEGARILHVGHPSASPMIVSFWAEVDTDAATVTREFTIFCTGHPIPSNYKYIGTDDRGGLIWHLYERVTQ